MDKEQYAMMAAYDELKDAIRIKRVNDELLEHLISSLRWLFHYSDKNHISLPERDKMKVLLARL
jgi:hypothetical protein